MVLVVTSKRTYLEPCWTHATVHFEAIVLNRLDGTLPYGYRFGRLSAKSTLRYVPGSRYRASSTPQAHVRMVSLEKHRDSGFMFEQCRISDNWSFIPLRKTAVISGRGS